MAMFILQFIIFLFFSLICQAEHHEILRKRRENTSSSLTWDEYKSMTFTLQVSLYIYTHTDHNMTILSDILL